MREQRGVRPAACSEPGVGRAHASRLGGCPAHQTRWKLPGDRRGVIVAGRTVLGPLAALMALDRRRGWPRCGSHIAICHAWPSSGQLGQPLVGLDSAGCAVGPNRAECSACDFGALDATPTDLQVVWAHAWADASVH